VPLNIQENVPLAPLTTLGVGGPARYFAYVRSPDEVREALEWARTRNLPLFVLGGGSNLLVSDRGFPGIVLRVAIAGILERPDANFVVGAGEDWDGFVARAVAAGCAGVECLSGIPGTVGGTPVQNVGAYGQEVSETIHQVEAFNIQDLSIRTFSNADCGFRYRSSTFNTTERGRWIILTVTFRLHRKGSPRIAYRDLKEYFANRNNGSPTLQQVRDAVREVRRSKAMLIVPGDDDSRSAGSFFKNPVLAPADYQRVVVLASTRGEKVPSYPADGQTFKIPAAWLVEHAGFAKGTTRGRVGISRKHALAIVNRGGASAADVIAIKNEIQQRVHDTFGIELVPEPVMVGFDVD
jgi:UDP-N-acetylmuramate dehydrogenase